MPTDVFNAEIPNVEAPILKEALFESLDVPFLREEGSFDIGLKGETLTLLGPLLNGEFSCPVFVILKAGEPNTAPAGFKGDTLNPDVPAFGTDEVPPAGFELLFSNCQ